MKKKYDIMHNIRGTRYAIILSKEVKGMPGFAPDYYEYEIGDLVVKFRDDILENGAYLQCHEAPPILDADDLKEILALMERGFVEDDFKDVS